ncbi:hypothetical protein CAEBREN_06710 [Caenorhabditis brenneri]|uniref:Uncharacterized protein n=1 Tax=Caenorhabditis brenneri TaxID=135651 RepID=G0PLV2_CAEBE|nr:hypothetical protein CAEBREN_06710 [Caenorhabditis brenneri]
MLDDAQRNGTRFDNLDAVWIGARRRKRCWTRKEIGERKGFNPNDKHPCSRRLVFEWENRAAQNPPDFEGRWITEGEPSFSGEAEMCVELLKGVKNRPNWPYNILGDKKLNDVHCECKFYFFCGKEAPTVEPDK